MASRSSAALQSHQRISSSIAIRASSNRLRIVRAGLPPTMAQGSTSRPADAIAGRGRRGGGAPPMRGQASAVSSVG